VRGMRRGTGQALPMVIGMMMVFGIAIATVLTLTLSNQSDTARTNDSAKAYNLAETGLNTAFSVLIHATDPSDPSVITGTTSTPIDNGTASYTGSLSGTTWTLTGTGSIPNPNPAGGPIVRRVSQQVTIAVTGTAWGWSTFVGNPAGCVNVNNNAIINTTMYVTGDLCLANGSKYTATDLYVNGTLTNNGTVGTSASPINSADIVGGCVGGGVHLCNPGDKVYATTISQTAQSLTKPTVDLANAYATAQPGPLNGCTTGSVPGGFDTDTTKNRSRSQFDLTPGSSYDCRYVDGAGTTVGQLTWNAGTSALTAKGVIYFDGDILSSGSATYTGRATIYSSGKVTFNNNASLCGIPGCTSSWDTTNNLILFVAGSSTDTYGYTLSNNTNVQAAAYAVTDAQISNNATQWGPLVVRDLSISNNATQSLPIVTLPPGAPDISSVIRPISGTWRG
jgi:Tfp pilus assembly protein PilX